MVSLLKKGKRFGAKKDKRGKQKWTKKAKERRNEKVMHYNYERIGSDDEAKEHEDLMKFGSVFICEIYL